MKQLHLSGLIQRKNSCWQPIWSKYSHGYQSYCFFTSFSYNDIVLATDSYASIVGHRMSIERKKFFCDENGYWVWGTWLIYYNKKQLACSSQSYLLNFIVCKKCFLLFLKRETIGLSGTDGRNSKNLLPRMCIILTVLYFICLNDIRLDKTKPRPQLHLTGLWWTKNVASDNHGLFSIMHIIMNVFSPSFI